LQHAGFYDQECGVERQEENEEHDSRTNSVSVSVTVMIAARQVYTFASDCGQGDAVALTIEEFRKWAQDTAAVINVYISCIQSSKPVVCGAVRPVLAVKKQGENQEPNCI